jgi:hypothetical protein
VDWIRLAHIKPTGALLKLLKPTDYIMYHQVNTQHFGIEFMCCVWISEKPVTFALYIINRSVIVTKVESVYCAVRTEFLYNTFVIRVVI